MAENTILVNLDRCAGCWTCSAACKTYYNLPDDTWRVSVRTLGSGEGIDKPAGIWPNLSMKWQPVYNNSCVLCKSRTDAGDVPYCVYSCPYEALSYGDLSDTASDAGQKLAALKEKGASVYQLPEWEGSKAGIVYASTR